MKLKNVSKVIMLCIATALYGQAAAQTSYFYEIEGAGPINAISPNGKILVGTINTANGTNGYYTNMPSVSTFNPSAAGRTIIPNSIEARAVNDNGDIIATRNETFGYTVKLGAVYRKKNGVYRWYSAGTGRRPNPLATSEAPTDIKCLDKAGNVYGSILLNGVQKIAPFRWNYNAAADNYTQDTMAYSQPVLSASSADQGSKILSVSEDGDIASGWVALSIYGGTRRPVFWASPTNYAAMSETFTGQADAVSPNGKYIALNKDERAAIYNVETGEYTVFGPERSRCNAVSNNGIVVGVHPRGYYASDGNQAFIWSEELGFMYFRQFLDRYAADANIQPVDVGGDIFFDFPNDRPIVDNPTAISADGRIIIGWCGYNMVASKSWVLCFTEDLRPSGIPKNLVANVDIALRNSVALTWDAPTATSADLEWYYIYRDGVYVNRVAAGITTFTDSNVPSGYHDYYVTAVYADNSESNSTNIANAAIVDNYNIPFLEDFETDGFLRNFWTTEDAPGYHWGALSEAGFKGLYGALFMGQGNGKPYNAPLTSKPFDAAGHNKVILTFMYTDTVVPTNPQMARDTMFVEVGTGNNWTKVKTIILNNKQWTPVTLDISSVAANNLFQVRFRAKSGSNGNFLNFDMDDFGISFEETTAAPSDLIAFRYKNNNDVNLIYKNIAGSYGLTYSTGLTFNSIGNYGSSFIAVNKYAAGDIEPLKNKYLTSISAFLRADKPETPARNASRFKIVVFVDGVRVDNSAVITSWKGNAWNNFPLANPIRISGTEQTILAGIEVLDDSYSLNEQLYVDGNPEINTKGNLCSEDLGQTWLNAHNYDIYGSWLITANFRDEATAPAIDADLFSVLYMVYRNGTALDTLHYGQQFVDSNPIENGCYTVKVFRSPSGISPLSESICSVIDLEHELESKLAITEYSEFAVYPNPTKDVVNITIDFQTIKVYDLNGKVLMQTSAKQVNVGNLANGIYIIEATLPSGSKAFAKIVKQ